MRGCCGSTRTGARCARPAARRWTSAARRIRRCRPRRCCWAWRAVGLACRARSRHDPDAPRVRAPPPSWPARGHRLRPGARCCTGARATVIAAPAAHGCFERVGRLGRCEGCASEHSPHRPGRHVAVTDGERPLLGRQADWRRGATDPGRLVSRAKRWSRPWCAKCRGIGGARAPLPLPRPQPRRSPSLMLGFIAEAEPDAAPQLTISRRAGSPARRWATHWLTHARTGPAALAAAVDLALAGRILAPGGAA